MDIPTISATKFRQTEKLLGNVWQEYLCAEIKKNGEEEKAIAIEKNNVDEDGVPHVTVYVDGGCLAGLNDHMVTTTVLRQEWFVSD